MSGGTQAWIIMNDDELFLCLLATRRGNVSQLIVRMFWWSVMRWWLMNEEWLEEVLLRWAASCHGTVTGHLIRSVSTSLTIIFIKQSSSERQVQSNHSSAGTGSKWRRSNVWNDWTGTRARWDLFQWVTMYEIVFHWQQNCDFHFHWKVYKLSHNIFSKWRLP